MNEGRPETVASEADGSVKIGRRGAGICSMNKIKSAMDDGPTMEECHCVIGYMRPADGNSCYLKGRLQAVTAGNSERGV